MIKNKKILVIGGTSGFGLEIAKQAVDQGASVTIIGQSQNHLKYALSSFDQDKTSITGQSFNAQDSNELASFLEESGNFDHVVSTLGGAMAGGFLDSLLETIRETIEDKFFANLNLAQHVVPYINDGGSLIFTSGTGGYPANASGAIIGNQAINTMVRGLAIETAPRIRVNAVAPTWTPTGLWHSMNEKELTEQTSQVSEGTPLKRVAKISEVASGYLFLIQNEFVTGEVLKIDGGTNVL